jgi:hypothetical protein
MECLNWELEMANYHYQSYLYILSFKPISDGLWKDHTSNFLLCQASN